MIFRLDQMNTQVISDNIQIRSNEYSGLDQTNDRIWIEYCSYENNGSKL